MSEMFRIPKEKDFKDLLQDADNNGLLEEEAASTVNNPLSWLRFTSGYGPILRYQEMKGEDPLDLKETEETKDLAKELERGVIGGPTRAIKSILEFGTAGIDFALDTDITSKLDNVTRKFLNEHGNPNTLVGDVTELIGQYALPSTVAFKIIGNFNKIGKLKNLGSLTKKAVGKIKNKYFREATNVALRSGRGALSLSLADMALSDADRPTIFTKKAKEDGLEGRDLATARLINKLKFGQEGLIIGGGIPLVGKGLALGFKYGIFKPTMFVGKIGAKTANAVVINPLSKIGAGSTTETIQGVASRLGNKKGILSKGGKFVLEKSKPLTQIIDLPGKYLLPTLAKAVSAVPGKIGEQITSRALLPMLSKGKVGGLTKTTVELPKFENWRMFSVDSVNPLKSSLKKIDNGLAYLRSISRFTPELAAISTRGQKEITSKARVVEKLLNSLETQAYKLAEGSKKIYNSKLASPSLQDKYLDDVLEYFKNQKQLASLPKELRPAAKSLNNILVETKKTFAKLLPGDSLIKETLENNIRGYMRKSFGVFTNPNFAVNQASKEFKDASAFALSVINKNKDLKETAAKMARRDGLSVSAAKNQLAKDQINDIIQYAKTDNRDPIQTITEISRKKLRLDNVISTGEELPDVIRKVMGEENNMKNVVLQTVSNLATQSTNKLMFDRLGEMLVRSKQLYKTREAAEFGYQITPDKLGKAITRVGKIDGLGLLNSNASRLFGPEDMINRMTTLKGPLDTLAQLPFYKNFLQLKVAAQYGKTVLSPSTQTRNFSSAAMFVINRGLLGNRASLQNSIKMTVDDIFNAGKLGPEAEKRVLSSVNEGIKYGALDENIVAAELGAVLRAIRKNSIKDTDQLTKYLETNGLLKTASRVYAGGDNVWKWYAYNWYKSFLNDYSSKSLPKMEKWFNDVAGQKLSKTKFDGSKMDLDEAIKQASAWYVRNTMPTYSMVPDAIKAVRVLPIGNFVSFPAEMTRTSYLTMRTNLREIASNDPVLREMGYRGLMGQFVTLGGASMAAKGIYGAVTGVTEELMDRYRQYVAPEFQRNSNLIAVSKPNDEGEFKVVDLSTFLPYDTVTRPIEAAFNKLKQQKMNPQSIDRFLMDFAFAGDGPFGEFLSPFLNRTLFYEALSEIRNNKKKSGGAIYSELADFTEKFLQGTEHLLVAMSPGAVTTAKQLYYGFREKLTGTGQSYDLEDVLLGLGTGVKPQKVNLKRSMEFIVSDLKKIRTEAPRGSDMYKLNRTKEQIKSDFIKQQRFAWREQQRIHNAFKTMIDIGLDEDFIFEEADSRKLQSGQIDLAVDGEFKALTFSIPRFQDKIEILENNLEKTGRKGKDLYVDEDNLFPESELEDIMDFLEDGDLNGIFPYDITTDPEPSQLGIGSIKQSNLSKAPLPVQPLPPQPKAVAVAPITKPINPTTGLTTTETALLSPTEQQIRINQRT